MFAGCARTSLMPRTPLISGATGAGAVSAEDASRTVSSPTSYWASVVPK